MARRIKMRLFNLLLPHVTPIRIYILSICLLGASVFAYANHLSFLHYSLEQWIVVYALLGAVMVLEHFTFQIPPASNKQSMDTSVYLACIFVYSLEMAIFILLLSSIIAAVREQSLSWWKHAVNFSIYSMSMFVATQVFTASGGQTGPLDSSQLAAYLLAMISYFVINTLTLGLYFYIAYKESLSELRKAFFAESLLVYVCTLLLSLVLTVLLYHNGFLGLAIFLALSSLLSHAFKLLFHMFRDVEQKANVDQRTGLFNHTQFENVLNCNVKTARGHSTPLSLALIDIDDFKAYNDHFGHLKGDQLLGFVGALLLKETEDTDITAYRYGGEEFSLLLPGYHADEAALFVNRLRKRLNDSLFEGVEIFPHGCLSFSAGIAEYRIDIYDKSQLVERADKALYYAKRQGKNTVHISGSLDNLERAIDLKQDINDIEQQLKLFLYKDIDTFKHSKRVFKYANDISKVLNLSPEERSRFVLGALIHDIGKLEIPWSILNKKEPLTCDEWNMVKGHVTWGKRIVEANGRFAELIPFIELHHERYDGGGYPYGFAGEEIPWLCRMLTIIDSFDAMTTERPYQRTKTFDEGLDELRKCSGTQFDPVLTEIFIEYITSIRPVSDQV